MNRRVLSRQIGLVLGATSLALTALPAAAQAPSRSADAQASVKASSSKAAPQNESGTKKAPQKLQTIVVTAERHRQNIQHVPVAVTAITSAQITRQGITSVNNLDAAAPGLVLEHNVSSSAPTISIRGTFNNDPSLFIDSPVAIYVNGVYYGKTAGAVFDLIDLQRIEVLRGPQGTLYGRNAFAGAINFITHKPSGIFNGRAQVTLGNFNERMGKVYMDLPAADLGALGKFKMSVGGRVDRRDGWFNTTPGSSVSQMNNQHSQSGFVDLLLDVSPNLSFNYRFDHHKQDQNPNYAQVIRSDILQDFGIPGIVAHQGRQTTGGVNAPVADDMTMNGQSFTAKWQIGEHNTLKYIYGWRKMERQQNLDLDGTILPFGMAQEHNKYRMRSNELQWLGKTDKFNWIIGLYRFDDTGFTHDPQSYFFGAAKTNLTYGFSTTSKAAYGQLNYHPDKHWTLTVGVRRTEDDRTGYETDASSGYQFVNFSGKTSDSATTPMASIAYRFNPEVMVYARYAKGFKGGGFNGQATSQAAASTPYGPEFKKSYELGVKSTLFNHKLRLAADVYYEKNSGLQETVAFSGKHQTTGTNIVNVGTSHDKGFELQMTARLSSNFSLRANYAYTKVKYEKYMVLGQNVADNRTVAGAPQNTFSLVADATFARTSYGVWRGMLDYSYIDSFYPGAGWIVPPPGAPSARDAFTPANHNLNLKVSLGGMNWGGNVTGKIAFWVHNATDNDHIDGKINFGPSFGNLLLGYYNEPRTYGISVIASW